jgi:hypothetical protein
MAPHFQRDRVFGHNEVASKDPRISVIVKGMKTTYRRLTAWQDPKLSVNATPLIMGYRRLSADHRISRQKNV